jgi:hypothetical protein
MQNSVQKWARNSMPGRGSPLLFLSRNFARESRFQATRAASAYNVAYLASPQNIGAETMEKRRDLAQRRAWAQTKRLSPGFVHGIEGSGT